MPELPEVETVKNELLPYVIRRQVTGLNLIWKGIAHQPPAAEFCSRLIGQTIKGITRRGKYLLFSLTGEEVLIIHLRMTGSLIVGHNSTEPPQYTRAIIHLDNNTNIFFRDPRKFGLMRLVKDENTIIGKLGPEPLDASFTPEILSQRLARRTAPIKALLCDQHLIAGIGNMYADETLFSAKINPLRSGGSLSSREISHLHQSIQKILRLAIINKGASVENYYRPDGTLGTAHFEFQVAHRLSGKSCPICGTNIERITVRNRGTYFCPHCQPEI
ncbi:MAG: bifunctional DNA-formamidopyrimidine glycosylase/DNA-(apurinic or apyrimidinic site) lyase [Dehalococcoidales bacterium]|nr:bifunctional DNA-formamidopyrimidine glycosylase/DNA-(apurinic or apyrimidinic site) lyase [Dehalococcoidales bacterium]